MTHPADIVCPVIHLNGSSPYVLVDHLTRARIALGNATDALRATVPNARDYYPLGDRVFAVAEQQHRTRMRGLEDALAEITVIEAHVRREIAKRKERP